MVRVRTLLITLAALGPLACSAPPAPRSPSVAPVPLGAPAPDAPPLELVESVPVETTLAHPSLRKAADVWLEMVGRARRTLDLAQFYASDAPGSRLEPVVAAIEAAVARGVRVRFLVEASFVKVYPETLARLTAAGVQVRHLDLSGATQGILHAKYLLVDDREAFLGSQNFDWRALEHNYELGARITDASVVGGIAAIFAADWARSGGDPAPTVAAPPAAGAVQLVASPQSLLPAGVAWDLPALVQLIDGATSSIRVQMLTYRADDNGAPWDALEAPLVRAAARGVEVQLLLADWCKRAKTIGGLQRLARASRIAIRLTTIPPWSGGFIPFARVTHAKVVVVDGVRGWLGTSNWEREYFVKSRNLGLMIRTAPIARQLEAFFMTLWQSPYAAPIDPEATYQPPRIQ